MWKKARFLSCFIEFYVVKETMEGTLKSRPEVSLP